MSPLDDFPIEVQSTDGLFKDCDFPNAQGLKQAAVLVPFVRVENEWHLLFIVRATNPKDRHSGQVAFPGGRQDESDDSIEHTALRETEEEIGVQADQIQLHTTLKPYVTISDYAVLDKQSAARHPVVVYKEQQECVLWGATARMTLNCFKAAMNKEFTTEPPLMFTNL